MCFVRACVYNNVHVLKITRACQSGGHRHRQPVNQRIEQSGRQAGRADEPQSARGIGTLATPTPLPLLSQWSLGLLRIIHLVILYALTTVSSPIYYTSTLGSLGRVESLTTIDTTYILCNMCKYVYSANARTLHAIVQLYHKPYTRNA